MLAIKTFKNTWRFIHPQQFVGIEVDNTADSCTLYLAGDAPHMIITGPMSSLRLVKAGMNVLDPVWLNKWTASDGNIDLAPYSEEDAAADQAQSPVEGNDGEDGN
jgi:hypothetical protein